MDRMASPRSGRYLLREALRQCMATHGISGHMRYLEERANPDGDGEIGTYRLHFARYCFRNVLARLVLVRRCATLNW